MKFLLFLLIPFLSLAQDTSFNRINTKMAFSYDTLKYKIKEIKKYITNSGYNTDIVLMIDMSIPSGKKRLFVYNLKSDSIEISGLVAHGIGSYKHGDSLVFSNNMNSNATSLGKYAIGISYIGKYGKSYRLIGLDSTNSKAISRDIVLHAYDMPNNEIYPYHAPMSLGCPMVSPLFFDTLKKYIKKSKKPILMWIYN